MACHGDDHTGQPAYQGQISMQHKGRNWFGTMKHHFGGCVVHDDEEAEKRGHECLQMQKPECYHHKIFKNA
jgi:hypothetical protein